MEMIKQEPTRASLIDIFSYHMYCNGKSAVECARAQASIVASLRQELPQGMPIILEETGSTAGPYTPFHDSIAEAAFVSPYVAGLADSGLAGAFWWVSSDLYTEHGSIPNYTWIPHQDYSGGMPRAEFTGRWGFITPSGIAKPIFRAFELLSKAGNERIAMLPGEGATGCGNGVHVFTVANATDAGMMIFLSNLSPVNASCHVTVDVGRHVTSAWLTRIDHARTNPVGAWHNQGSPSFPTLSQLKALRDASAVQTDRIPVAGNIEVTLPPTALYVVAL